MPKGFTVQVLINLKLELPTGSHKYNFKIVCKMMKNFFYFVLKALSALKIFKLLSQHFRHVRKTV